MLKTDYLFKLGPLMRGLTACLWSRPIYAFIWMLWTTAAFEGLALYMHREGGVFVRQTLFMMVILAIQILLGSLWLLLLILKKAGRKWLVTVYHDKDFKKMGAFGCFLIRALPVLEALVIAFIFISGN